MTRQIDDYTGQIHTGNCFDILEEMPDNSVHAVVADGPYGLAFMGQTWDDFEPLEYQRWSCRWAKKAKRVLKPGGHLLSFSGTRTYHRMASGVEDAGYEIRDCLMWAYGTGFPKALDVSKAIDKQAGKEDERDVVGEHKYADRQPNNTTDADNMAFHEEYDGSTIHSGLATKETAPATPEAEQWDGFKTSLKPAFEPVVVARKSLSESTVAENVLQHGTGALNIDSCRIETEANPDGYWPADDEDHEGTIPDDKLYGNGRTTGSGQNTKGRYPANLVLDEQAGAMLDEQSGECPTGDINDVEYEDEGSDIYGSYGNRVVNHTGDSGGASRYFYCAKASKAERTLDGAIDNKHPTVKPVDLMDWLVTLVTAEDQIVLDPFAGSGTTCKAAKEAGREFIGIEKNAEYADIARARCGLKPADPEVLTGDEQSALSSFVKAERAETDGGQRQ